ncbi:MAG: disulfide bond formation protein B [Alphaproteobacteria bacterium]
MSVVRHVMQTPRLWLALVAAYAVGLVLSAFVLEHGFGVIPCQMCMWQRYAHWGILGVGVAGVMFPKHAKLWAFGVAACALAGLYVAVWQSGAQVGLWSFPASCTGWGQTLANDAGNLLDAMAHTKIVPCDKEQFRLLGLTLAMWNIPAMVAVLAVAVWGGRR